MLRKATICGHGTCGFRPLRFSAADQLGFKEFLQVHPGNKPGDMIHGFYDVIEVQVVTPH
jgi:hypothetical protein